MLALMGRSGAARRRSRKRRAAGAGPGPAAPAGAPAPPAVRAAPAASHRPAARPGRRRTVERPPAPWHPVPLTEVAIAAGLVAFVVGLLSASTPALLVGIVILLLAVIELVAREHFAGFRSHTLLLALTVTVAVQAVLGLVAGSTFFGPVALAVDVPVFAVLFVAFRARYRESRDLRSIGR
jgi:hypothetical protein